MDPKQLLVMGLPQGSHDPETELGLPTEYISSLADIVDVDDPEDAKNELIALARKGTLLYVAEAISSDDKKLLNAIEQFVPDFVIDEGIELLKQQLGNPITDPHQFEQAVFDAEDKFLTGTKVEFHYDHDLGDNVCVFHEPDRLSSKHTLKWCQDGTIELDGMIVRKTALVGKGHVKQSMLGGDVLDPAQVVGFIASRLAVNGISDLIGYGRAFGPGKEDHTNASLTPRSRKFRAEGLVGVVTVTTNAVGKAHWEMVCEVADLLHQQDPDRPIFLHQQCKELYVDEAAMEAFRATREEDGRITLGGKSSKHTRVDAGAYVLYTEDGTSTIRVPAILGQFEEGNDGSIYAPKKLLDSIGGYLKERVRAVKDFKNMSPDLIARYFNSFPMVSEGDRLEPGSPVFEVDGVIHTWETKADYGIVRRVVNTATQEMVEISIEIDAWFVGDCKVRGFGKGLVCPSEAAGVSCNHDGFIIGVPGIIKDSFAACEYIHDPEEVTAAVTSIFCPENYELAKQKHAPLQPVEDAGDLWEREYPNGVKLIFDDRNLTVATIDPHAIKCEIDISIEASPVAQSVGSSAMTMPQLAWLSSLPTGNKWLTKAALPGIKRRTNSLAYLHAVARHVEIE